MKKQMLVPSSLALLLLFVVMVAPVYPTRATESVYDCPALPPGCTTVSREESIVWKSPFEVVSHNFRWESATKSLNFGMDYSLTIRVYEANPFILVLYLSVPLLAFFMAYVVLRRSGHGKGLGS